MCMRPILSANKREISQLHAHAPYAYTQAAIRQRTHLIMDRKGKLCSIFFDIITGMHLKWMHAGIESVGQAFIART